MAARVRATEPPLQENAMNRLDRLRPRALNRSEIPSSQKGGHAIRWDRRIQHGDLPGRSGIPHVQSCARDLSADRGEGSGGTSPSALRRPVSEVPFGCDRWVNRKAGQILWWRRDLSSIYDASSTNHE